MLATAILMGVASPAFANTETTPSTTNPMNTTQVSQQVSDVKTTVENGKVVTVIKYTDGTETQVITALPNVVGNGSSTTTKVEKVVDPQYNAPVATTSKTATAETKTSLDSNDDTVRRTALQNLTGIKFTDDDKVWNNDDKKFTDANGKEVKHTTVAEMKTGGFYAVNANRQELILYGVRTGDWQPYYQLEYQKSPLYYSLAEDGKLSLSKIYHAKELESEVQRYREELTNWYQKDLALTVKKEDIIGKHKKNVNELLTKWKAAKGPVTYIIGINSSDAYAKEWGIDTVPSAYFDSVYNDPMVHREGKFSPGASTKTWY